MCDDCPSTSTTCSPPETPKAARRSKHPGNPKVRIDPADLAWLRNEAMPGATDAFTLRGLLASAKMADDLQTKIKSFGDERDEAIRERDAERATVKEYSELVQRSVHTATELARERNTFAARLARLDALAASLACRVEQDGGDTVVTLPGYPEVIGRDRSPTVARLEAAVSGAGYLPSVVAEAMRERDTARTAAEEAASKLADEKQAHAATAAALAACNARVERLTAALATAEANAADSARRIEAQRKMLEKRDERLTANAWTIGGLAIGLVTALLGLALVVA